MSAGRSEAEIVAYDREHDRDRPRADGEQDETSPFYPGTAADPGNNRMTDPPAWPNCMGGPIALEVGRGL